MSNHTVTVSNGTKVPRVAYGTGTAWFKSNANELDQKLINSVKDAIKAGFVHIDTAEMYNTEREVGEAIKQSGIKRDELFLTTKIYKSLQTLEDRFDEQLKDLQVDFVDLYLIHSPYVNSKKYHGPGGDIKEYWKRMEKLVSSGKTKSIGVSNFQIEHLKEILSIATIKPVVNQIEYHPYLLQEDLIKFCNDNDIKIEAYSPLTPLTDKKGGKVEAVVNELGEKYSKSPLQILLKWSTQKGAVAVTTSSKTDRLKESVNIADFELTNEELEKISDAGRGTTIRKYWADDISN
ncbi:hypothetical protein AKO1_006140 [Acrasis kona]|uniref:NADP-dependent oxidoreductase domain-containing protein n=1 Tax=Acrasis kona TaxID=1008807 RepID=A0AAW2YHI8_9EUKA